MRTLPNELTISRALAAGLIIALYVLTGYDTWASRAAIVAIYGCAALTDWLDGWLAKRYGWMTTFGRHADPVADKLLFWAVVAIMWSQRSASEGTQGYFVTFAAVILAFDFFSLGSQAAEALSKPELKALLITRIRSFVLQVGLGIFLLCELAALTGAKGVAGLPLSIELATLSLAALFAGWALTLISMACYAYLFLFRPACLRPA